MRINYVTYKNYRCFDNLRIDFFTTDERNISMVVAPNGGGKTEILFSFWWALYDFDFKKLKGKSYTPYALNSTLYQNLVNGKVGEHCSCVVTLSFEHNNNTFIITREEIFIKNNSGISQNQTVCLEQKNLLTGETLPLKQNPKDIEAILTRIIPKSILGGIIFDGERMKKLSQVDEDARKAVEGIIKQITNEDLFVRCGLELKSVQKDNSRKLQEHTRKTGNIDISMVEGQINTLTAQRDLASNKIISLNNSLEEFQNSINEIHDSLSALEDSRLYEEQRKNAKKNLIDYTKALEEDIEKLYKDLNQGSALIMSKIIKDVQNSLDTVDIPSGLNVSAVKSILARTQCICGHDMTDDMRNTLKELIKNLPPDNINSTLMEMARQMGVYSHDVSRVLQSTYQGLESREQKVNELHDQIAHISTLITEGASSQAQKLEAEYQIVNRRYGEASSRLNEMIQAKNKADDDIQQLLKQRELASVGKDAVEYYTKRDMYINKCISALEKIHEFNMRDSVNQINHRLSDIYAEISEDSGRSLYITQFGPQRNNYRLISFLKEDYNKRKAKYYNSGRIHKLEVAGMTDEQIDEIIIDELAQNSSTGQSKINSLAFAKAILEYSSRERDSKTTEISRDYPFLIDSPFTELSNDNLNLSAQKIHSFAKQIVLLISEESLSGVYKYLEPYVYSTAYLTKNSNETTSTLLKTEIYGN